MSTENISDEREDAGVDTGADAGQDGGAVDGGKEQTPPGDKDPVQAELSRLAGEITKLREEKAKMEGMFEATRSAQAAEAKPVPDPLEALFPQDMEEKFFEDAKVPVAALKGVAEYVRGLQKSTAAEVAALRAEMRNMSPERQQMRSKIDELRADPRLRAWPVEALELMAEKMVGTAAEPEARKDFYGSPGGSRAKAGGAAEKQAEKLLNEELRRMGYLD